MKPILSLAAALVLFSGCVSSTNDKHLSVDNIPMLKKDNGEAKQIKAKLPSTVAIIPFLSEDERASKVVTKFFYNSFSTLKYKDIEPDTIYRVLKDKSLEQINSMDIQTLGKLLGVDGIIMGRVTDFDKLFAGLYSSVTVGADIKFYNVKTKDVIWEFDADAAKREGGIAVDPIGIAVQLAMAAYNLRDVQMYRAAEDLFRDVFKTIPQPLHTGTQELPKLKFAINNIKSKKAFKAGDELMFALDAEPNLDVFVSIPAEKNLIQLTQIQPGHYETVYRVSNDIAYVNGNVEYILRHKNGLESKFYDLYGQMQIDNIPPKTPKLQYSIENEKVKVKFIDNTGDEISKFILQKLEDNQYEEFMISDKNNIEFPLHKGEFVYLKPYLEDIAGNRSPIVQEPVLISNLEDTRMLKAVELPIVIEDMNLKQTAIIKNDTQISGNLRVKPGAVLFISSNINIKLLDNGTIMNEGGEILAYGSNGKSVINSINEKPSILLSSGVTTFNNLTIKAPRAIVLQNSAKLDAKNIAISAYYDALKVTQSASVNISSSKISASKDMADITIDGVAKAVLDNVSFSQSNLFDVSSSSMKETKVTNSGKIKILGNVHVEE